MNEVLIQLVQYMIAFTGVIFLFFFTVNFLTKGFLLTYLGVKAGNGRRVLVRIHSVADIYYKMGKWTDGFLSFKNRGKEEKSLQIDEATFRSLVQHSLGVALVEVDDTGNKILTADWNTAVFSVDTGRLNTTLIRIKNRPVPKTKQEQILILLAVLTMLAILFLIFKITNIETIITELGKISGNIR